LGMAAYGECRAILEGLEVVLEERKDANGGKALRELIDARFDAVGGWEVQKTGGIDWKKASAHGESNPMLGVEIQVSARSDLVVRDVIHLRNELESGMIDVGVIVVPSDRMAVFLTDRCPNLREAKRAIEEDMRAHHLPLVLLGIEHDGTGPALRKQERVS